VAGDPFEERLRAGLERIAADARPSPDARDRLHRRVRREPARRVGIVVASYAMVVVVAALAFVGVRLRDQRAEDVAVTPIPTPGPTTPGVLPTNTTPGSTVAPATTAAPAAPTPTEPPPAVDPTGSTVFSRPFVDVPQSRERTPQTIPLVTRLEAGRHDDEGYDRVVIEFDGPLPGYDVRYVDRVVQDGSGQPVPLLGGADLQVVVRPANAHDDSGQPTLATSRLAPGFTVIKEARLVGDFEGVVTVGIGVGSRAPFRVIELTSPNRLVIDVQHPR
jgi:hypothetical protein